jgi:hypothetical protein
MEYGVFDEGDAIAPFLVPVGSEVREDIDDPAGGQAEGIVVDIEVGVGKPCEVVDAVGVVVKGLWEKSGVMNYEF